MKTPLALLACVALALSSIAAAQVEPSRESRASVDVANFDYNPGVGLWLDGRASNVGAPVQSSAERSFSGLNRAGQEATMHYSAESWASSPGFRRLHTRASGSLEGAFYNPDNTPYFDASDPDPANWVVNKDGVPDFVASFGTAQFTDALYFDWGPSSPRTVRYIFAIRGELEGDVGECAAILSFTMTGTNPYLWITHAANPGPVFSVVGTDSIPVVRGIRIPATVRFTATVQTDLHHVPDGIDLVASCDFSAINRHGHAWTTDSSRGQEGEYAAVLERIETMDEHGNPVNDVTVTSESGTVYPIGPPDALFADGFDAPQSTATAIRVEASNCESVVASIAKGPAAHAKLRELLACERE